ncbi:hypothetical protein J0H33_17340, partial [bacterium]|nr:hypothetical protein [bacterium]
GDVRMRVLPVLSFNGVALSGGSVAGSGDAAGVMSGPDGSFTRDVDKARSCAAIASCGSACCNCIVGSVVMRVRCAAKSRAAAHAGGGMHRAMARERRDGEKDEAEGTGRRWNLASSLNYSDCSPLAMMIADTA